MNPDNFTTHPFGSVLGNYESEVVARNIMCILARTDNKWRELGWEEYKKERTKDGGFSSNDKSYFYKVVSYTASAEQAERFCSGWGSK